MGYFNFYLLKKIIKKLLNNKIIFAFIFLIFIYFIKCNVFAATVPVYTTYDVEYELKQQEKEIQDNFVLHCMYPFAGNTEYWNNVLKPIFDDIKTHDYDFYIGRIKNNTSVTYFIRTYYIGSGSVSDAVYTPDLLGTSDQVDIRYYTVAATGYNVVYNPSTNSGTSTTYSSASFKFPLVQLSVKSELFISFMNTIYNGGDYGDLLSSINNSLNSISSIDSDILSSLNSLSQSLVAIQNNTSTNYSQQISQISNKISDILTDNDTIISQNSQMIQEQQEINDNLEQLSDDIQDVKDTLTDDTVESSASDLPSTNVQDPSQSGIDNIFQSIYNAFCNGQAQDIVFPIPFTNKNITLSPYYVRDALNNNNAGWVYTLIQAFWGYLIGRYIVSDISKKIDKIKSGNIENVENSNIKEEML